MNAKIFMLSVLLSSSCIQGICQAPPVAWTFYADSVQHGQAVVVFSAKLAEGWKLYSQQMNEGGPIPTRFCFDKVTGMMTEGATLEKGILVQSYSEIYGMDIRWYSDQVVFSQQIRFEKQSQLTGVIHYMICDDTVCIPEKRPFVVLLFQTPSK